MKTKIKLPTAIQQNLQMLLPYKNEMTAMLINRGYSIPQDFDILAYKFYLVFKDQFSNPDIDFGFFSDVFEGIKGFGNSFANIIQSGGSALSGIIDAALGGAGNILGSVQGGQGGQSGDPQKSGMDTTTILIIIGVIAAGGFFLLKK
jgi:hypothetical protein